MNTNRPSFFEPYPKMPERLVYRLKIHVYENGVECYFFDPREVSEEIKKFFYYYDKQFTIGWSGEVDGPVKLTLCYLDYDDNDLPIPSEWLKKTLTFGHPKKERELRLVGDRLPITIRDHPSMEVRFTDE